MCARNLLPSPSPFDAPATRPGDIDELHRGGQDALRMHDRGEFLQARIGHRHHADVRIDGAERIILRCDLRARERIEQRGFADIRQSDDSASNGHQVFPARLCSLVIARSAPCSSIKGMQSAAVFTASKIRSSSARGARVNT